MDDWQRKSTGASGEDIALAFLLERGLRLILRNYRCRSGELDLVMLDGAVLAVVEVRYRSSRRFGSAAESVTYPKQRRIISAAKHLTLTHRELRRFPVRFDIVGISPGAADDGIEWLRAAFDERVQ